MHQENLEKKIGAHSMQKRVYYHIVYEEALNCQVKSLTSQVNSPNKAMHDLFHFLTFLIHCSSSLLLRDLIPPTHTNSRLAF